MYKKIGILALILSSALYAQEQVNEEDFGIKLHESTITSDRYETPVIETAKNVTIITSEEIEKRGYQTVEEAIVSIPGVMYDDFNNNISMRGQMPLAGKSNIMDLVDGIPQNGLDNRDYDLDYIPIDQIEKIEVLPSGGAVMYGGNATGGVINIITKGNQDKKYWGSAGLTSGSFSERKYKLNYGTNITDKLSLEGKYINSEKDGYRDGAYKDSEFIDIGTKYKLNNGSVGLKYIRNKKESNWGGSLSKEEIDKYGRKYNRLPKNYQENTEDRYILTFDKQLTENLSVLFNGEYKEREYTPIKNNKDTNNIARKSSPKETEQLYTNLQLKYTYAPESYVVLGGDYSDADVEEKSFDYKDKTNPFKIKSVTKADYNLYAGYISNRYKYNDFVFTQGIRIEKSEFDEKVNDRVKGTSKRTKNDSTDVSYDLGVNYMINEGTSIYATFNRASRAPNIGEYSSWYKDVKGNPDSQTTTTYEAGVKTTVKNVYLSGAAFYTAGDKEIVYDPSRSSASSKYYYNIEGKTERIGLEVASEQYFDKITLRESFTYMEHEMTSGKYKGKDIPGVSNFIGNIGFTYEPIENLALNLDTRYVGKSYASRDFENEGGKISSYTLTNISARYAFSNGVSVSAGIKNLFDKEYCDYTYYDYKAKDLLYFPSPERTYYVSAEYKF